MFNLVKNLFSAGQKPQTWPKTPAATGQNGPKNGQNLAKNPRLKTQNSQNMVVTTNLSETGRIARYYAMASIAVLRKNGIQSAKIVNANRGARHISLNAKLNPLELDKALRLSEQIALETSSESVLTFRDLGVVVLQFGLRKHLWKTYTRQNTPIDAIGMAESETPVVFEFPISRPHAAFVGTTGSGKTESIKTVLWTLAATHKPDELKIVLLDVFGNFEHFDNLAHLAIPRATTTDDIDNAIKYTEAELKNRIATKNKDAHRLVLVCDETETVFNTSAKIDRLKAIAKTGRQFKVNLILGSQEFKETDLPGVTNELNNRFVGLVKDAGVSARATGQAGLNAHKLLGAGDFLHVAGNKATRFQVAQVLEGDYTRLPRAEIRPVVLGDIEPDSIRNFADTQPDQGGRPAVELNPATLALYVYHWPNLPSRNEASKTYDVKRTEHDLTRQFLLDFMGEYHKLLGNDIRGMLQ